MLNPLSFEHPLAMGIINVTPDSFAGDGLLQQKDYINAALLQAVQMVKDGAGILDIGGESSRPGATLISAEAEIERVVPVIKALRQHGIKAPVSVDTVKAEVAQAALDAGADIINDVSALAHDPLMGAVVAQTGAWLVLMHNRSHSQDIIRDQNLGNAYQAAVYNNVVDDVMKDLKERIAMAQRVGVQKNKIILDPGIGFGKTVEQNCELINHLDRFKDLGCPVLLGASRKNFIGKILNTTPDDRLEGTAAVVALAVARGASILRVHDVKFMSRVVAMAEAVLKAGVKKSA